MQQSIRAGANGFPLGGTVIPEPGATSVAALVERSLRQGEGVLSRDGALLVETGAHTGRSARDKFVVREEGIADSIWWAGNRALEPEGFRALLSDMLEYLGERDFLVQDLDACADPEYRLRVRVVTERAWHALAIRNLLRPPEPASVRAPDFAILHLPGFTADPERHGVRSGTAIAFSFDRRLVLIAGTEYSGEIKKSVFTYLNYVLPAREVMPMHCSANHRPDDSGDSAVFFGLSGTGKTTLSTVPDRVLVGDDELGWRDGGLFNFEGGCYAKTLRLSAEREPEIFRASNRFGTVLENVSFDSESRAPDFDDASRTENGRSAYPLDAVSNASPTACAGEPRHVVMLACDAFSVLPPISRLSIEQAEYYFLSGFTSRVAGTELGVSEPAPTFSACFGAPFLPRPPVRYGRLLRRCLQRRAPACWMLNTGWLGGAPGEGRRVPLEATRALLAAALEGALDSVPMRRDPSFGFQVPSAAPGIDPSLLDPAGAWSDPQRHADAARRLVGLFRDNFRKFDSQVHASVRDAAPVPA